MNQLYFNKFEKRRPYEPLRDNKIRTLFFQLAGILTVVSGGIYIFWRWMYSLNYEAPVFSITLAFAESVSFISIFFFIFDMWKNKDAEMKAPPRYLSDIEDLEGKKDRPLQIDVFITTINEGAELLRYTIKDAKIMKYPHQDVDVKIFVLDDGRRDGRSADKENIKQLCQEEGVIYLTRDGNEGFKAGNLKNGLAHSSGDIFVILDADTRPFPDFLKNTLGYFRNHKVAWVQTCQWFYDITPAIPLSSYLIRTFRIKSPKLKRLIHSFTFNIKTGEDIFGSDPRQFYQVIQRRRNFHNASFCCGAGSVHRREAVMTSAVESFAGSFNEKFSRIKVSIPSANSPVINHAKKEILKDTNMTPFRFHASEDLYTSMVIHSNKKYKWESVMHPYVESKLLSPQDIGSFVKQRSRYAEGSIDIALRDSPLFRKGLSWRQKICYFNSVWSYFSCLWIMVFLASPIYFFYTGTMPVTCNTIDFFIYFVPFFLLVKITGALGCWGISQKRGKQYHVCLFWLNFMALVRVIAGRKMKFNVTPKTRQKVHPFRYAWPHITIVILTMTGLLMNIVPAATGKIDFMAMVINALWALQNCYVLTVYIRAAYWDAEKLSAPDEEIQTEKFPMPLFVNKLSAQVMTIWSKTKT